MTDYQEAEDRVEDEAEDQTVEETVEEVIPDPETVTVNVVNIVGDEEVMLYERTDDFTNYDNVMKGTRQKIRDLALHVDDQRVTIRQAVVEATDSRDYIKITFDNAEVRAEVSAPASRVGQSTARKNASATVATEEDQEIVGVVRDDTVSEEDAREALSAYTRHQLIRAYNVTLDSESEDRLSHYTTKVGAIEALLTFASS